MKKIKHILPVFVLASQVAFAQTAPAPIVTNFGLANRVNKGSVEFKVSYSTRLNSVNNAVMNDIPAPAPVKNAPKGCSAGMCPAGALEVDPVATNGADVKAKGLDPAQNIGVSLNYNTPLDSKGRPLPAPHQYLQLRVLDGGDGNAYDHADWAGAQLMCASGTIYLSDLAKKTASATSIGLVSSSVKNGWGPFELDKSNGEALAGDGHPISLRGNFYPKGLGVHATSNLIFDITGMGCTKFVSDVGVDDEVAGYTNDQNVVSVTPNLGTPFDGTSGWLDENGDSFTGTDILLSDARYRRAQDKTTGTAIEELGYRTDYASVTDSGIVFQARAQGTQGNGYKITITGPATLAATVSSLAQAWLPSSFIESAGFLSKGTSVTCNATSMTIANPSYIRADVINSINTAQCPVQAADADYVFGYIPKAQTLTTANGVDDSSYDNLGFVAAANMPIRAGDKNSPTPSSAYAYNALIHLQKDKGSSYGGQHPYLNYGGMQFSLIGNRFSNYNGRWQIQFVQDQSGSLGDNVSLTYTSPIHLTPGKITVTIGSKFQSFPDELRLKVAKAFSDAHAATSDAYFPVSATVLPSVSADPTASALLALSGGVDPNDSVPDGQDYNPIYEQVLSSPSQKAKISVLSGDSYFVDSNHQIAVASSASDILNQEGSYALLFMSPMTLDGSAVRSDFTAALSRAKVSGTIVTPIASDYALMKRYCSSVSGSTTALDCSVATPSPCVKTTSGVYDCSKAATHFIGTGATVTGTLFLQAGPQAVNAKISQVTVQPIEQYKPLTVWSAPFLIYTDIFHMCSLDGSICTLADQSEQYEKRYVSCQDQLTGKTIDDSFCANSASAGGVPGEFRLVDSMFVCLGDQQGASPNASCPATAYGVNGSDGYAVNDIPSLATMGTSGGFKQNYTLTTDLYVYGQDFTSLFSGSGSFALASAYNDATGKPAALYGPVISVDLTSGPGDICNPAQCNYDGFNYEYLGSLRASKKYVFVDIVSPVIRMQVSDPNVSLSLSDVNGNQYCTAYPDGTGALVCSMGDNCGGDLSCIIKPNSEVMLNGNCSNGGNIDWNSLTCSSPIPTCNPGTTLLGTQGIAGFGCYSDGTQVDPSTTLTPPAANCNQIVDPTGQGATWCTVSGTSLDIIAAFDFNPGTKINYLYLSADGEYLIYGPTTGYANWAGPQGSYSPVTDGNITYLANGGGATSLVTCDGGGNIPNPYYLTAVGLACADSSSQVSFYSPDNSHVCINGPGSAFAADGTNCAPVTVYYQISSH